jgi:plastocyanin
MIQFLRPIYPAAVLAIATLAAVTLLSCGGSSAAPKDDPNGANDPGTITIKMFDNSFKPADITVSAGSTVTFQLPNVGQLPHNMHIASARGVYRESPWISTPDPTNAGQTSSLTWEVPSPAGKYLFRCDYHEVEMVGTLTVQ